MYNKPVHTNIYLIQDVIKYMYNFNSSLQECEMYFCFNLIITRIV